MLFLTKNGPWSTSCLSLACADWFRSATRVIPALKTKRILRGPLDTLLAHKEIDASFALAWADFAMTKRAQGFAVKGAKETQLKFGSTFMPNDHSHDDDLEHALWLTKNVFSDPRHLKVDGKPLFAIFAAEPTRYRLNFLQVLRSTARQQLGLELYIVEFVQHTLSGEGATRMAKGKRHPDDVDSLLLFAGGFQKYSERERLHDECHASTQTSSILHRVEAGAKKLVSCNVIDYQRVAEANIAATAAVWEARANATHAFDPPVPSAMPGWDNTGRYPNGGPSLFIAKGSTPARFGSWVSKLMRYGTQAPKLVAINAVNEWGEGCHLEPDTKYGMAYYEALAAAKQSTLLANTQDALAATQHALAATRAGASTRQRLD